MLLVVFSCIFEYDLNTSIYNKYSTNIQLMKIINKTLEPTVREALLSLVKNTDCLVYDASRKRYVRGEIGKIQREDDNLKFKTKVKHGEIYVWRIFLDEKHSIIK